jgi:hypothetical protein
VACQLEQLGQLAPRPLSILELWESEPMGTLGLLPWLEGGGRREEERPAGRSHRDGPVLMPVAAKTHALPRYKRIGSVGARTLPS